MLLKKNLSVVLSVLLITAPAFANSQVDDQAYQTAYQATVNDIAESAQPQERADAILSTDKKSLSEQAEIKAQEVAEKIAAQEKANPSKKSKILGGVRDGAYVGAAMMGACLLFQHGEEDHIDAKKCATSLAIGAVAGVGLGLIIRHFEKKNENKTSAQ